MEFSRQIPLILEELLPETAGTPATSERDWRLCAEGKVSEAELMNAYAQASKLPILTEEDLSATLEPYPGIPPEYWRSNCILPLQWDEETIELGVSDCYHCEQTICHMALFHHLISNFSLVGRSLLERRINEIYFPAVDESCQQEESEEMLRSLASEGKIIRLVNDLFSQALERRASDIHVEPEADELVIRFRTDGVLHEYLSCPISQYPAIASRIKLIGNLNIAESRLPQDGRTSIRNGKQEMDVRISTLPTMHGESIVLRLLKKDSVAFNLSAIGMSDTIRHDFERLIAIPHGMILVVGPTGSGKSTTLYGAVSMLNDRKNKIITIEDPVEYQIPHLTQVQVNPAVGVTFAAGLRSIVRQDPDVILVGEIRDRETADIAINAALTGHLVLSTLHTNDAAGAVSRLLDMGVEHYLLASALYGVLSQRLLRTVCHKCNGKGLLQSHGKCRQCNGSGFYGRTGIFELLTVNEAIRSAIAARASSSEIRILAQSHGMKPLLNDGLAKVQAGITTEAEVRRAAMEM